MKKIRWGIIFFSLILLIPFLSVVNSLSDSKIGNPSNSIGENYTLGSMITGWINISLNKEPANSLIKTNFGDSIELMDLINQNDIAGNLPYSCSPIDCSFDYSIKSDGVSDKTFLLEGGKEHIFGLKFTGADFAGVSDFSMKITSDAGESNLKQLFVDFNADDLIEWQPHSGSGNYYGENYGCYNSSTGKSSITSTTNLCEKVHALVSPSVEIGAYVINPANPTANFMLTIDNENGNSASCETQASKEGRIACIPQNFQIGRNGDYYVCIKAKTAADSFKYEINSETGGNSCGYATTKTNVKDFQVFASFEKFAAINTIELDSLEAVDSGGSEIEPEVGNYISEKYANDCTNDCIVPIKISSNYENDQTITIADVNLKYSSGGEDFLKNGFETYELSEEPAKINSEYIKLNVDDANFSLPGRFGDVNLSINMSDTQLFSKIIEILEVPQITYLRPVVAMAAFPTEFEVHVETFGSEAEIIGYEWVFGSVETSENELGMTGSVIEGTTCGDGLLDDTEECDDGNNINGDGCSEICRDEFLESLPEDGQGNFSPNQFSSGSIGTHGGIITTENKITYTFDKIGEATVEVFITDSSGFTTSKTFNIAVATPKKAVESLLKENTDNLNNLKTFIDGLSAFEQDSLKSALGFGNFETKISEIQQKNAVAVSDDDYVPLVNELIEIRIPGSVDITKNVESIIFYSSRENINLNILQKVGGGDYAGNEEKYLDAILSWELLNVQTRLSSKEFTANYNNNIEEILNTFELSVNENLGAQGSYLIMPKFENMMFGGDYSQKEEEENIYMQLNGGEKIVFSTTEDIEFTELPFFISPSLTEIQIQKGFIIDTEKISKQTLIALAILLVTFIGFIIYIVMQQWYKKKYENYLFKNKNDLYNIISYVHNMNKQGVEDRKVSAGLRKAGWNSEQITYIMRKYYGKRTGMLEIPISKIINLFRRKRNSINYPTQRSFNGRENLINNNNKYNKRWQ